MAGERSEGSISYRITFNAQHSIEPQISSATILIAPHGHSATHMPQPLQ
jgi:hypothetical protein